MIKTDLTIPDWRLRDLQPNDEDVILTWNDVHSDAERKSWFFTGSIGELIRARKIPRSIDIVLDLEDQFAIARLEYQPGGDGLNEDGDHRSLYAFLSFESFAILWNTKPDNVSGIPGDRISLHVNPSELRYQTTIDDVPVILWFEDNEFKITIDMPRAAERLDQEAA